MYEKITLSGKICTGKSTLFKDLSESLHWPTYSAGQFFRLYVTKHNLTLEKADEQNPQITKEVDYGMQKMLKEQPHIILEGWMAGIMADDLPDVLRILLICDDVERIKRFAERENVTEEIAREKIYEREANLFDKLEEIYNRRDFVDPQNYNLVIDTTVKTSFDVLTVVLKHLK